MTVVIQNLFGTMMKADFKSDVDLSNEQLLCQNYLHFFMYILSRKTKCTVQILLVILHLHVCWLVQIQIVRVFATFMVCWSVKCVLPSSTSRIASETKIISALA